MGKNVSFILNNPKSNHILSALSQQEYQHFSDRLEPVQLDLNEILIEANQKCESLYFPTQGVVSLLSVMQDGSTTEIGLIGQEGVLTSPVVETHRILS